MQLKIFKAFLYSLGVVLWGNGFPRGQFIGGIFPSVVIENRDKKRGVGSSLPWGNLSRRKFFGDAFPADAFFLETFSAIESINELKSCSKKEKSYSLEMLVQFQVAVLFEGKILASKYMLKNYCRNCK